MNGQKSYRLLKAVLALSFCFLFPADGWASQPAKSPEKSTEQKILAEFAIAKGGEPILLPVRFKGEKHLFVFDTAATWTVFDNAFKRELGNVKRTQKGFTAGGTLMAEVFDAPEAFVGPLSLGDSGEVTCLDLKMFSLIGGKKISGIIGMNFLRKYIVQIDFDKGRLLFLERTTGRNPNWGEELAISYNSLVLPQIEGHMPDGIKVDFGIDTGDNSTGNLESRIFREIISKKKLKTSETLFQTASGTIRQKQARTDRLSIEQFAYQDLIFGEGNWSCLGLLFLSRHLVTFDFPNSRIYLKKGKEFKRADEADMSGLHLLRISNKIMVYSVDEGSPAQKAGIKAYDVILKIGNKDANRYDMWELRRVLMSGDKQSIMMTIKRGDDIREASFLLERKI